MRARLLLPLAIALAVASACGRERVDLPFATPRGIPTPHLSLPAVVGDGHDGDVTISTPSTTVNVCHVATGTGTQLAAGNAAGLSTGRLLVVLQVQDTFGAAIASTADLTSIGDAGAAELTRIVAMQGTSLTVAPALSRTYRSNSTAHAELCTIPEYHDLHVTTAGSIATVSWDGARGGVIAVFATGTVRVDGAIDASGAGFQGGAPSANGGMTPVTTATTSTTDGGGRGESVDPASFGANGRGDLGNGAGGGNAYNAGGGGGAGAGRGGQGGFDEVGTPGTPGMGGAAVLVPRRFVFGGGGGGGHQNNGVGGAGGAGGGVVWIAAMHLAGAGAVRANGADGRVGGDGANADGAGGGGGGGTVVIAAAASSWTGIVSARGGGGGNLDQPVANNPRGPGGGGGGGHVVMVGAPAASAIAAEGAPGVDLMNGQITNGALKGAPGLIESDPAALP